MPSSKLQDKVARLLFNKYAWLTIKENHRPQWLINDAGQRLELDFYIEDFEIGIEVQGKQHVVFTPHFHANHQAFADQLGRDRDKKHLCKRAGVTLVEIYSASEIPSIVELVNSQMQSLPVDKQELMRNKYRLMVQCKYARKLAKYLYDNRHPTLPHATQMADGLNNRLQRHGFRAISAEELITFTRALYPEEKKKYRSYIKVYKSLLGLEGKSSPNLPFRETIARRRESSIVLPGESR